MYLRLTLVALLASIAGSTAAVAQPPRPYKVPRTEHGHPDFQGIWATAFLTMLERLPGVDGLVATPEQAEKLVAAIRGKMSGLVDPDVFVHDIRQLAMVKGQYRTSLIVDPADGKMPYTKAGLDTRGQGQRSQRAAIRQPGRPAVCRALPREPGLSADPHGAGLSSAADRADSGLRRDFRRGSARLTADPSEGREHARFDPHHRRLFGGPVGRRHAGCAHDKPANRRPGANIGGPADAAQPRQPDHGMVHTRI